MKRNSNIELLRIICAIGVIILHINNPTMGGVLFHYNLGSLNKVFINYFESIFIVAVNMFILISGYFMADKYERDIWRVIEILFQVSLFRIINFFVEIILEVSDFSIKQMIISALPVNYFAVIYCALYLISPYIYLATNKLSNRNRTIMLIVLFTLFSIIPTFLDFITEITKSSYNGLNPIGLYGSQFGYSIVQFVLMYIIGIYVKSIQGIISRIARYKFFIIAIICSVLLTIWSEINEITGFLTERTAWSYCNPILIIECTSIFICFINAKLYYNKYINILSKSVFTSYLFHGTIISLVDFSIIVNDNIIISCVYILLIAVAILGLSAIIDLFYKSIVISFLKRIENRFPFVINVLSKDNKDEKG